MSLPGLPAFPGGGGRDTEVEAEIEDDGKVEIEVDD
jgi:hypothetical protein